MVTVVVHTCAKALCLESSDQSGEFFNGVAYPNYQAL